SPPSTLFPYTTLFRSAKLGISGAKVRQAMKELAQERIDAAVKSGELTPQQAARIKSCMNGGSCPRPHWLRGGPRRFRGGLHMGRSEEHTSELQSQSNL